MSGVKDTIVNLRQSEYNRLMQACQRVGSLDQEIRRAVENRERDIRRDLEKEVSQRCRALEQSLSETDDTIAEMHREHSQAIEQQARQTEQRYRSIEHRMEAQRGEILGLLKDQEHRFTDSLEGQRRNFDDKIRQINERARVKELREQDMAETWLRDTGAFLDFLGGQYRHEKFAPGELERLRGQLSLASRNAAGQQYQAALATVQQTFFQAQELRSRLELREMEWNLYFQEAQKRALEVIAACDAQATCKFAFDVVSDAGATEKVEIAGEIDRWTRGGLSSLLSKARGEQCQLEPPAAATLTLDDLKRLTEVAASNQAELENLTMRARETIIASQLRHNIACQIEDALRDEGWEVIDSTYEAEDQREALHVKLSHLNGAEIVAQIRPQESPDGQISNVVSMAFYDDATMDERVIQSRLGKVTQSVSQQGLTVGLPTCAPGFEHTHRGDEQRRDFDRVRQAARQEDSTSTKK